MKRRITSFLLVFALAFSMVIPATAANAGGCNNNSANTLFRYVLAARTDQGQTVCTPCDWLDRADGTSVLVQLLKVLTSCESPAAPEPPATQPDPPVTEPEPPATQPDPPVTEPEPPVTQPDPPVTEPEPPVTQPDPPVTEPDPQPPVTESGLTQAKVYEAMIALKSSYPEGMRWTNANYYAWKGGIYTGGYGCAGFAFILSDAAFGNLPARWVEPVKFADVRVGDILRVNNNTHSVIVLEKTAAGVVIAEGNYNSSIHWGRTLTKAQVEASDYMLTRYPK